jgi:flagellar hook assembly protein FlgD
VKKLVNELQTTGEYRVVWDGKDETGSIMPSGIYFAKLVTQQCVKTTKMMLLK